MEDKKPRSSFHSVSRIKESLIVWHCCAPKIHPNDSVRSDLTQPRPTRTDIAQMCTETTYTLRCEHVVTRTLYCSEAPPPSRPGKKRRTCKRVIRSSVPWPPPPERGTPVKCPLPQCPFELRGGYWNCCWCGKEWNDQGRCSCIMLIDRQEYRCEHICCETCEAAVEWVTGS